MKIRVKTLFDCSVTGTTGNFRPARLPYQDRSQNLITDHASWSRSRNRQRNWETLLQVLGLRCQIENIQDSDRRDGLWQFCFEVGNPAVYGNSDFDLLLQDCEGVPMIQHIDLENPSMAVLITQGPQQNIWFEIINT